MAHKCVRCGRVYESNNEIVLKGCICDGKLFVFIPDNKLTEKDKELLEKTKKELEEIKKGKKNKKTTREKQKKEIKETKEFNKIEEEIKKLFNIKKEDVLVLPLEAIQVVDEGKFLIDINKLFQEKAIVIKTKDGQYVVQIY